MFGRRMVGKPAEPVSRTVVPGALSVADIKK
jgi:hypothetical protein